MSLICWFDQRGIFVSQSSLRFKRFGVFKNTLISPHLVNKELNLSSAPRNMVAPQYDVFLRSSQREQGIGGGSLVTRPLGMTYERAFPACKGRISNHWEHFPSKNLLFLRIFGQHVKNPLHRVGRSVNSGKQNIGYARQQVILRQHSAGQEELEEASSVTLSHARSRCFLWWFAGLLLQFLNSSPDK